MSLTTRTLACGATLVVEATSSVGSVALSWRLPAGSASDAPEAVGVSAMVGELIFRGAGTLSSREHSDALDRVGVQRSSHVSTDHMAIDAVCLGERLGDALPLFATLLTQPAFHPDGLDAVRSLCLQSLESLPDDPQRLVMLRLRERHLPPPFNRHGYGEATVLEHATIEACRDTWKTRCRPKGSILALAGALDVDRVATQLDELLEGWSGEATEPTPSGPGRGGVEHVQQETAQVHLGLAQAAPTACDPDTDLERLAISVLSGGTSARLFQEVRAKRSLCYSVGASYQAGRDRGVVTLYAGTTPQRAQETFDVCCREIDRLRAGVEREEFDRAVLGLKSHLVMQGESTSARAATIGADQYRLGSPRTLQERLAQIDRVTLDAVNAYLQRRSFAPLTVASIGAEPLEVTEPSSAPRSPSIDRV